MTKKPTFFQERKDFIRRMILEEHHKTIQWSKEQGAAKRVFEKYPLDFLSKVSPPFKMNSILWFNTPKGREFLDKKLREFKYVPTQTEKVVEVSEKVGEDIVINKRSLIDFLNS